MKLALLIVFFLAVPLQAEQILIRKQSGCDHIVVTRLDGTPIIISTLVEMKEQIKRADDFFLLQVKFYIRESGLTTLSQIKTMLESKDFILD